MQKVILVTGNPEDTVSVPTTDTAQTLEDMGVVVSSDPANQVPNARKVNYAIITVESAPVRVGAGSPSTSLGHRYDVSTEIILESAEEIQNMKFISAVAGSPATLQITTEFRD
jgi:hypothetical protein